MCRLSSRLGLALGLLCLLLTLGPLGAAAQPAPAPAPALDPAKVQGLIGTLENEQERAKFIDQLRTLVQASDAAKAEGPKSVDEFGLSLVEVFTDRINQLGAWAVDLSRLIVDLPDLTDWLVEQAKNPFNRSYWLEIILKIALVIAAAEVGYQLVRRLIKPRLRQLEGGSYPQLAERVPAVVMQVLLRLTPIIAFAVLGYLVLPLIASRPATEVIARSLIHASVFCLILLLAGRALLSPSAPNLRLIQLSDERANYLYCWLKRFVYLVAYAYVVFQNELVLRMPAAIHGGIVRLLGFIVALMLIVFVLQNRKTVAQWLRGHDELEGSTFERSFVMTRRLIADIWPVFAIFYVLSTYLIWAFDIPGGFTLLLRGALATTILLAIARPLAYGVKRSLAHGIWIGPELSRRYPVLERRVNRYCALLQRIAVTAVYFLILLALVHLWGIDLFGFMQDLVGDDAARQLRRVGFVILTTWLIWEVTSLLIENYLDATDEAGARIERSGRARTLLPLMRTFLLVLISVVVTLTTLSTLGIDITPILAAAGVIGIAVGFGSQKLVQDIINGLFILFQDTVAIGDVVEVGGHAGLVEKISVRTISLRGGKGEVHTIPFSAVSTIKNLTKDHSFATFNISVGYRENIDLVCEMIKQVGAELEAEPEFGQYMLAPIEVWGIDSFTDNAVVVSGRIKTKALKQWYVGREFNRRLKQRFDQVGIGMPLPQQVIFAEESHPPAETTAKAKAAESAATKSEALRLVEAERGRARRGPDNAR